MPSRERLECDVLIIGAGAAGCLAALTLAREAPGLTTVLIDRARPSRSGSLASGAERLDPDPARADFSPADADLAEPLFAELEPTLELLRGLGLRIGEPLTGGGLRIHGENLKGRLSRAVESTAVQVLSDYFVGGLLTTNESRVCGALAFEVRQERFLELRSRAVLLATGATSGLFGGGLLSDLGPHSPYNSGAALGLPVGARLVHPGELYRPLVLADSRAPARCLLEFAAEVVDGAGKSLGTTEEAELNRLLATDPRGERGPYRVVLADDSPQALAELKRRYLEHHPAAVLRWAAQDCPRRSLELRRGAPILDGGSTRAGLGIDGRRRTTAPGLWAAGSCAGGLTGKGLLGRMAEGRLAARVLADDLPDDPGPLDESPVDALQDFIGAPLIRLTRVGSGIRPRDYTERLRRIMDDYAPDGPPSTPARSAAAAEALVELDAAAELLLAASHLELAEAALARQRVELARALLSSSGSSR